MIEDMVRLHRSIRGRLKRSLCLVDTLLRDEVSPTSGGFAAQGRSDDHSETRDAQGERDE